MPRTIWRLGISNTGCRHRGSGCSHQRALMEACEGTAHVSVGPLAGAGPAHPKTVLGSWGQPSHFCAFLDRVMWDCVQAEWSVEGSKRFALFVVQIRGQNSAAWHKTQRGVEERLPRQRVGVVPGGGCSNGPRDGQSCMRGKGGWQHAQKCGRRSGEGPPAIGALQNGQS